MKLLLKIVLTTVCLLMALGLSILLSLMPSAQPSEVRVLVAVEVLIFLFLVYPGVIGYQRHAPSGRVRAMVMIFSMAIAILGFMLAARHELYYGLALTIPCLALVIFLVKGGDFLAMDVYRAWKIRALEDAPKRMLVGFAIYAAVFLFGTGGYSLLSVGKWLEPFIVMSLVAGLVYYRQSLLLILWRPQGREPSREELVAHFERTKQYTYDEQVRGFDAKYDADVAQSRMAQKTFFKLLVFGLSMLLGFVIMGMAMYILYFWSFGVQRFLPRKSLNAV